MITEPHELSTYINKKAIVQIAIGRNSTGRIKILSAENPLEFPAKADLAVSKNSEVFIERFLGAVAYVIPLPSRDETTHNDLFQCEKCKATIDSTIEFCPYCGARIESVYINE